MKAKALREGDEVILQGAPWSVLSATKQGHGMIQLTVADARGQTFSKAVPKDREFDCSREDGDGVGVITAVLGATELWREYPDGARVVHFVDESTVAAHLLAWHGVTWEGVTLAEARVHGGKPVMAGKRVSHIDPVAERTMTPQQALAAADYAGIMALHHNLHHGDIVTPPNHSHADLRPTDPNDG